MPGRRLTSADRQRIAAGLAQGLDYTEIARRLGRPTSTVSREVARNGGPGRYRADLAQLATTHRARRRPHSPAARGVGPDSGSATGSAHSPNAAARSAADPDAATGSALDPNPAAGSGPDPDAAAGFAADLTAALVETGMPRTPAGVLACLLTAETGSRTAAELARQLRVSPATVSLAVGLLEQQGLIRHARDGRRHRYFLDEAAGVRSAVVSVQANQRLAATALRGAAIFGVDTPTGTRLAVAGRFLEQVGDDIIRSVERHWPTERRETLTPQQPRDDVRCAR